MYQEGLISLLDWLDLDSERMHCLARDSLGLAEKVPGGVKAVELLLADQHKRFSDPRLAVTLGKNCQSQFQVHLDNRTILGAGWDKLGVSVRTWIKGLGVGGVSVGAVLPRAQLGNMKPRQWYENGRGRNSLGFNSPGVDKVLDNLAKYYMSGLPIGINIGINKDTPHSDAPKAYAYVLKRFYHLMSWAEINISSPNTTGLRLLQDPFPLGDILDACIGVMEELGGVKPLYPKVTSDLTKKKQPTWYKLS